MDNDAAQNVRLARVDPLDVLTHELRLMSVAQIGRRWFAHADSPRRAAAEWLRRKARRGMVECWTMTLYPELAIEEPLCEWRRGMREPDFGAIAWRAASRWREAPVATVVAQATYKARALTGGFIGGRPIRQSEANHDHHVAAVYLALEKASDRNLCWKSEDELKAIGRSYAGGLLPDAFDAATLTAIDFIGSYSSRKLARMHRAFEDSDYLWF